MEENTFEESGNYLQSSLNMLHNSGMFGQNVEDLPFALKQLDECLHKSNQNIFELKETLKFVLERESNLQNDFNVLSQRFEFNKHLYSNKEHQLTHNYAVKIAKLQETSKRIPKLEQELENERKKIKDQDKELTEFHKKFLQEHEKLAISEKECTKLKYTVEKLHETMKVLNEEAQTWKERTTALRSQLENKDKEIDEFQKLYDIEKAQTKRIIEKNEENLKKYENKEKKWIEIYEERRTSDNEIKNKLEEARYTFKELERVKKDQDQENSNLKLENTGLRYRVEGLEKELDVLKKQSIKDINEKARVSDELEKIHQELAQRETKIKDLGDRREKYIKDLESQIAGLSTVQSSLKKHENLLVDKATQLEKLKAENAQLKAAINDLNDRLSKEQEEKTIKSKLLSQSEENYKLISSEYQTTLYNNEQLSIQLKILQSSLKKSEETYEAHILALKSTIDETKFTFEEKLQQLDYEKSRAESDLKKVRSDHTSYETTSKKAHSEIELWKAGLMDIACLKVIERPRVEDMLRALLGVAPERISGYDIEQAEYINGVIKKIKDILLTHSYTGDIQGTDALERTQVLLQEITEKYRKEMAERRRLHQLLQDLRGNIRVMCRVRPLSTSEKHLGESITVMDTCQVKVMNMMTRRENWFEFDRVFPPTDSQEVVYYEVSDLVTSAMNGFNVCIMAYGQTGSGKTYTMEGTSKSLGINYRAVKEIFEIIDSRTDTHTYSIEISILEVYNEQIRDLLNPSSKKIEIREDSKGSMHVNGIEYFSVSGYKDIINAIETGKNSRSVGCTNVNEYSSRSHSIVTIYIHCNTTDNSFTSKLNLIDLAGSERICKSEAEGLRMFEACNINQSLTTLGKVLSSLAGKQPHIPYRDSKLTHLLRDSLSGDAKTMMIITVNPSPEDVSESASSLSFGARVASVEKGKAKQQIKKKKKKTGDCDTENNFTGSSPKLAKK
jgi:Kinesin motor domain